jgi:hypothetical protein
MLAVPSGQHDIYRLHQQVWAHVDRLKRRMTPPNFIYRREGGLVRVRVEGDGARGTPVRESFVLGQEIEVRVHLVLDRDGLLLSDTEAKTRATRLLENAGFAVRGIRLLMCRAEGRKRNMDITLTTAQVQVRCMVQDEALVTRAWVTGIGRGKRFGYGMPIAA